MEHYVAYHSTKIMGHSYTPNAAFNFVSDKSEQVLRKAIGAWAWVIVGDRNNSRTQFRLVGVYSPETIASDGGHHVITGPGAPFDPPIDLNELPWFVSLQKEQGNFGFGFNSIQSEPVIAELERLLADKVAQQGAASGANTVTFSRSETEQAHERLQAWRREHNDGFVLNCLTATTGMIHRADCAHMGDAEWMTDIGQDLTHQRKVCSTSLPALRGWARSQSFSQLKTCADCSPVEDREVLPEIAIALLEEGCFTPDSSVDGRQRVLASIVQRQGQPAFRQRLIRAYRGRCAVTGCDVEAVLEAAHILPYRGVCTNHPQNGLLLRTDIHTLFDLGLIAVDPESMKIVVAQTLSNSSYASFAGKPLNLPEEPMFRPSPVALDEHFRKSGLTTKRFSGGGAR